MQKLYEELRDGVVAGHYLLGTRSSLEYLGNCRKWIQKILEKAHSGDKECSLFGKRRDKLLITPMDGRYKEIVDLSKCLNKSDGDLPYPIDTLYKNNNAYRQIMFENIPVSFLYWESDSEFIENIESDENLNSNKLLYRCIVHTDPIFHEELLDHIDFTDLKKTYWILCQACLFYRGSASVAEMMVSVIAGKLLCNDYGLDVHALVNDYDSFDKKFTLKFKENKSKPLKLEDLKLIYYKISKGCDSVWDLLYPNTLGMSLTEEIEI